VLCVLSVGGPNVSRPVQMSTNNNARVGVKRPALESVTHNNVQVCLPIGTARMADFLCISVL